MILEICAGSLSSALAARIGGAHRIELCDNLSEGGTTPSPGIIRQAANAMEGASLIAGLVSRAGNRIIIMPGAGINEENIPDLQHKTKAVEFHASLRGQVNSRMKFRNEKSIMGIAGENEYTRMETDPEKVRTLLDKLNSIL